MGPKQPMPTLQLNIETADTALRFESKQLRTIVSISPSVVEHFIEHRQEGKIKTEIGGQLFAKFSKNEVQVLTATGPNNIDRQGWSWFRPNLRNQNSEIKRLFKNGLHFVGDWHTHPERAPSPSSWDLESMEDCFKKSRHQLKAFLMIIVGRAEFPKGFWVSLHNEKTWERLAPVKK
jgi:integrative and conjugative element protein (TIGR02256 family)